MTPEEIAAKENADAEKIGNLVNSAVTSQLKRALPKMLEEHVTPLFEKFHALLPKAQETKAAPAPSKDDEFASRFSALENDLRKEKEGRAKERREARETKAFGDLRTVLTGKVRPEAVETAAKFLFHADRRVKVDDKGSITFTHGDRDDYDLEEGVSEWAKSKDAGLFVAVPGYDPKKRTALTGSRSAVPAQPGAKETPLQKTTRQLEELQLKV